MFLPINSLQMTLLIYSLYTIDEVTVNTTGHGEKQIHVLLIGFLLEKHQLVTVRTGMG